MKLWSFVLIASVAVAGYAHAQTATQTPAAAPAAPAPSSSASDSEHLGHACKEEVHKLCGHAHGQEMKDCVKSGLDLNKFSADCKTKLTQAAKPSG
jgi:ABC-type nickel/cobalt efflux system permease component RcnA